MIERMDAKKCSKAVGKGMRQVSYFIRSPVALSRDVELTIVGTIIAISGSIIMIFDTLREVWIRLTRSEGAYWLYRTQSQTWKERKRKLIRDIVGSVLHILGVILFAYELGRLSG